MAKSKKSEATAPRPYGDFTGVAFSAQASKDSGTFSNFRICTLFIVDGEIVHVERSQEYATFETIARTEIFVNAALWNLSARYEPGAYQSLGGDARDELVRRLEKSNPDLLKRISPALYMPEPEAPKEKRA